jgi:chromate reductase, NAD(P)H dehydrogenase (quinone)
MKIVAFGASCSKRSINRKFAGFAAKQFNHSEIEILDLNNYKLPLFTVDAESEIGFPENVKSFLNKLEEADLLVISMAEHNGSYTAAFKNLFDWASRLKMKMFEGKKILLLSTSPGQRGGLNVIEAAKNRFPKHGAEIIATFSLPYFQENFNAEKGILNEELNKQFREAILTTKNKLANQII